MTLEDSIVIFISKWAPPARYRDEFITDLRRLLEEYGRNAIRHGDLPDTEHPHREKGDQ